MLCPVTFTVCHLHQSVPVARVPTPQVFSVGDIRPNQVAEPEARAALIWILGEFGQHVAGEGEGPSWEGLGMT